MLPAGFSLRTSCSLSIHRRSLALHPRFINHLHSNAVKHHTRTSRVESMADCNSQTVNVGSAASIAAPASSACAADMQQQDPIVQYVILRRDLWSDLKWPVGSVVAQACHASSAAMWMHKDDEATVQYLTDIDHMHKVVLEVKGEAQLRNLSAKLSELGIHHKLWVEQPEDFPTCLATKPYVKSQVAAHFKKLQLCKAAIGAA